MKRTKAPWPQLLAERLRRGEPPLSATLTAEAALPEIPISCQGLVTDLVKSVSHPDPVFRGLVGTRLPLIAEQVRDWSHGRLTFSGTEVWRTAYEKILTAPEITEYRSVAWLKSGEYWRDLPGQHGMQLNFDILDRGVRIERALILGWNLWPPELRLPHESVRRWIDEQYYRGVSVSLVRECDLVTEQDLLRDFGIYGDRAVGELHIDDDSRTVSFTLTFEKGAVDLANEHWARLKLFSRAYAQLIEAGDSNHSRSRLTSVPASRPTPDA